MEMADFKEQLNKISDSIDEIKDNMSKRDADTQLLTFRLAQAETELLMVKKRVDDLEKKPIKKTSEKVEKITDWVLKGVLTFLTAAVLFYLQSLLK